MPPMWRASAFYLLFFAALGAIYPFLTLFYQQAGMSSARIGVLAALLPLVTMTAAPLWGVLADWLHFHRRLLPFAMLATIPCMASLWQANTFPGLVISVGAFAAFLAPITPLADSAVLHRLAEHRYTYGRFRLWGSVGFGSTAWIAGELIETFGKPAAFALAMALMMLAVMLTHPLVAPRPRPAQSLGPAILRMASDVRWMSFLLASFLSGIGFSVFNNYLVLYLKSLGAGEGFLGFLVGVSSLSELPFFFYSAHLMHKWSPRGLLLISYALLSLRCLLTSLLRQPTPAIIIQLLQGPTFSAGWAAGVAYADDTAPSQLSATAQSAFGAAQFGLAGAVGGLFGGHVYGALGAPFLFLLTGFIVCTGLFVFGIGGARRSPPASR